MVDPHALAAHELDDPLGLVGHRGADRDLHAERFEPAGEPRGVRIFGVSRDKLVPNRQDGGEHMPSMTIRPIDPARDADQIVALLYATNPTMVTNAAEWQHRRAATPARARLVSFAAEMDGRIVGSVHAGLDLFGSGESPGWTSGSSRPAASAGSAASCTGSAWNTC